MEHSSPRGRLSSTQFYRSAIMSLNFSPVVQYEQRTSNEGAEYVPASQLYKITKDLRLLNLSWHPLTAPTVKAHGALLRRGPAKSV